ncbi:tetratricopeptide repeat protein [Limibacter armeniacum]|uniref:tetratricopeptide repeat protein n=1 Tax=Limibacter armeniacum TaxID=466084 RepID=UPI002FE6699B
MRKYWLLTLFFFSISLTHAQEHFLDGVDSTYIVLGRIANRHLSAADSLLQNNYYDSALTHFDTALVHYEEIYGQGNPQNSKVYQGVARMLIDAGYSTKGVDYYLKGLTLLEAQPSPDFSLIGHFNALIAKVYQHHELPDIAMDYYTKALEAFSKSDGKAYYREMINIELLFANTYRDAKNYGQAVNYYKKAAQHISEIDSEVRADVADIYTHIASCLNETGSNKLAVNYLKSAIRINKEIFGDQSLEIGKSYSKLTSVLLSQHAYDSASVYGEKALRVYFQYPVLKNETNLFQQQVARAFFDGAKYDTSAKWFQRLLNGIHESETQLERIEQLSKLYAQTAHIFATKKEFKIAIDFYYQLLGIYNHLYGTDNLKSAKVLGDLSGIFAASGDFQQALACNKKMTLIQQSLEANKNGQFAASLIDAGALFQLDGNLDSASTYYQKALTHVSADKSRWRAMALNNLSMVYYEHQQYDTALTYAAKLKDYYTTYFHPDYIKSVGSDLLIANIYFAQGRQDKALDHYQKILKIAPLLFTKSNSVALGACQNLVEIYKEKGELSKMKKFQRFADDIQKVLEEEQQMLFLE